MSKLMFFSNGEAPEAALCLRICECFCAKSCLGTLKSNTALLTKTVSEFGKWL